MEHEPTSADLYHAIGILIIAIARRMPADTAQQLAAELRGLAPMLERQKPGAAETVRRFAQAFQAPRPN